MTTGDVPWAALERAEAPVVDTGGRRLPAWRRLAAIALAIGAIEPIALTGSLSHAGGGGGEIGALSYSFNAAVHRPDAVLALTAAVLWITAAGLWAARTPRLVAAAALSAVLAVAGCAVALATTTPPRTAPVPRFDLALIRRGESEAAVVAWLGPPPYRGSTVPSDPDQSIPCLVYNASQTAGAQGPDMAFVVLCFRGGRLVLKAPIP